MNRIVASAIIAVLAVPAFAEGDAAKGEKAFKKCKACHTIENDAGEAIVKGGKTGPNLYGVAGRPAGSVEGFKYSDSLVAAGEKGLVWDETTFVEYTRNPKEFLQTYLEDSGAKSKMTFKLKEGGEDIFAFLQSVASE
ncbi:cytochrome C [Ruegeria marisrubri]|uniref:Cytochrome C n=1 Tax=Ruegeria marisrubri TaxID=1685379 RepID=A0A0X3TTA1_9RHOB|nr:c-type cytochrome [Ruegeria marisrubri]KUJ76470.1 cytochrome C [Ruegeria marisrubri]